MTKQSGLIPDEEFVRSYYAAFKLEYPPPPRSNTRSFIYQCRVIRSQPDVKLAYRLWDGKDKYGREKCPSCSRSSGGFGFCGSCGYMGERVPLDNMKACELAALYEVNLPDMRRLENPLADCSPAAKIRSTAYGYFIKEVVAGELPESPVYIRGRVHHYDRSRPGYSGYLFRPEVEFRGMLDNEHLREVWENLGMRFRDTLQGREHAEEQRVRSNRERER
jgi:hypothetical protein